MYIIAIHFQRLFPILPSFESVRNISFNHHKKRLMYYICSTNRKLIDLFQKCKIVCVNFLICILFGSNTSTPTLPWKGVGVATYSLLYVTIWSTYFLLYTSVSLFVAFNEQIVYTKLFQHFVSPFSSYLPKLNYFTVVNNI